MEALVAAGKILRRGVSNLDRSDMDELARAGGQWCATSQILYNITERGAEFDLLPWLRNMAWRSWPTAPWAKAGCRTPRPWRR
jgi:diketogulonate reductase-like aldo/keto reductase